ncbi:LysR substrate-binding domain-containing protein [Variovorax dokdonensis]|uniref:LysR substrate-binding domain-containing protein n=1 Tax=Variovorax dokdonensis TaxID=344883 RepID=A0ABT7N609_9BURK|nr:LysR substrate-binding domain-containing protein [Variovorax dokdonensis]MDM0043357.1 LysR substrate-binding domain-containing protein [Variovorax dokdonensis]
MKHHQLRALVAVAGHGSIRGAARSLSLSQTALTKSLRELELDLQAALLQRSPQGVRLTPVGLELLRHAKLILAEIDEARASVRHMLGQGTPGVNVAVTPAFSVLCLPETVARFRTRYPDAALSIRDSFISQTLPMLRDGTIDVAIAALLTEELGSDLTFESNGRLEVALAGRPGGFEDGPYRLADAAEAAPWLLDGSRGGISEAVRQWLSQHQVSPPSRVIECPSSLAALVLSTNGRAIAPVPRAMLAVPWIAAISRELPIVEPLPTVPFGVVLRKDSRLEAPAAWFVECARLVMREVSLSV